MQKTNNGYLSDLLGTIIGIVFFSFVLATLLTRAGLYRNVSMFLLASHCALVLFCLCIRRRPSKTTQSIFERVITYGGVFLWVFYENIPIRLNSIPNS